MRTFFIKMTNTITIKTNQRNLTYIPTVGSLVQSFDKVGRFFIIFRNVTVVAMLFFFFLSFDLLDTLKAASFIYGFSCLVLISYVVKIPCSLSMLIEFRYALSSSADILGSNLIGRDLGTF
jgi:hypothetical protein